MIVAGASLSCASRSSRRARRKVAATDNLKVPKGPTPSAQLAPGNVDALCAGSRSLVRILDVRRERARRTGGASSFPTASLPRVASRPAVLMPAASRPSPCVSSRRWAARHTTARRPSCSSRSRSWLRLPRPAMAPTVAGSASDDSDDDAPAAATPAKRRLTMRQANLLSPDHGKRTFFVVKVRRASNFPKISLRSENQGRDWRAELAEDAAAFAGAPTAAAARAFTRRASLLREVCGTSNASAARRSLDAVVAREGAARKRPRCQHKPGRGRRRLPCAICRAPRRRACPRTTTACSTTCYAGCKRAENASALSAESTKVLTADGARVATVVDGAHATAAPPAEPSPAEPAVVAKDAPAAAGLAALYEATVEVAEAHKDDDGVGLAAASVLLALHAAVAIERSGESASTNRVVVSAAALDGTCALATQLFGRAQTRLGSTEADPGVGKRVRAALRYDDRQDEIDDIYKRQVERRIDARLWLRWRRRERSATTSGASARRSNALGSTWPGRSLAPCAHPQPRRSADRRGSPRSLRRRAGTRASRTRGVMLRCRRVYFGTALRRDVTVVFAPSTVTMEWRSNTSRSYIQTRLAPSHMTSFDMYHARRAARGDDPSTILAAVTGRGPWSSPSAGSSEVGAFGT